MSITLSERARRWVTRVTQVRLAAALSNRSAC